MGEGFYILLYSLLSPIWLLAWEQMGGDCPNLKVKMHLLLLCKSRDYTIDLEFRVVTFFFWIWNQRATWKLLLLVPNDIADKLWSVTVLKARNSFFAVIPLLYGSEWDLVGTLLYYWRLDILNGLNGQTPPPNLYCFKQLPWEPGQFPSSKK